METIIDNKTPLQKIYKDRAVWLGTFIGGPLIAGYLMAENFKVFNERDKARKAWIYSIIVTLIIFGSVFLINTEKFPDKLIPILYVGVAFYLVQRYQKEKIEAHISEGGPVYSFWRSAGIGLIGLVVTILPIILILGFTDSTLTANTKTYGNLKHEILYNKSDISDNEVDMIAKGLKEVGFFDEAEQKSIFVRKEGKTFVLSIFIVKDAINDVNLTLMFDQLRMDLQSFFPANPIAIDLCGDDITDVKKRLD